MQHPVFKSGNTAVITGGASGIGLAAAKTFAALGLNVAIADLGGEKLQAAGKDVAALSPRGADAVATIPTDVGKLADLEILADDVAARFGNTHVVMNNAGIQGGSALFGPRSSNGRRCSPSISGVSSMAVGCSDRAYSPIANRP